MTQTTQAVILLSRGGYSHAPQKQLNKVIASLQAAGRAAPPPVQISSPPTCGNGSKPTSSPTMTTFWWRKAAVSIPAITGR